MKIAAIKAALAAGMCICPPGLFVAGVAVQHQRHHRHHDALAAVTVTPQVKEPVMPTLVSAIPECLPTVNPVEPLTQQVNLLQPIYIPPTIGGGPTPNGPTPPTPPVHPAPEPSTLSDVLAGIALMFGFLALRRRYVRR